MFLLLPAGFVNNPSVSVSLPMLESRLFHIEIAHPGCTPLLRCVSRDRNERPSYAVIQRINNAGFCIDARIEIPGPTTFCEFALLCSNQVRPEDTWVSRPANCMEASGLCSVEISRRRGLTREGGLRPIRECPAADPTLGR